MKARILPIFIISSLLIIGVFGFLGFGSIDHTAQHNCPIPLMSGGVCPAAGNAMTFVSHHVSGLQYFTQSVIGIGGSLLMLTILLAFTFVGFSKLSQEESSQHPLSYAVYRRITEFRFIPKRQFLSWLALRHKRDPHAPYWVYEVA